ncbi:hypothetical protein PENCOP_c013G00324 [Penicillium coprophilum]|uniref:Amidohydrolase 3 domain-containing protein n=1 Tax=Penicillium coprophilum TaxID=36646 RepID=A0A1V6UAL4_9EURO|nr:hypothetical protein PENCOP_c013G00324 [Penicillium coprophilum]
MVTTVFTNGRILCPDSSGCFVSTLVVEDDNVAHVGWENDEAVVQTLATALKVDLKNRMVLPGFIDSHVHILNFGMSLQKLDLLPCKSLADIQNAIISYAATHPSDPRILCRGWVQSVTDGQALATDLDDLDSRPIYIEALDLHSTWCNNAALRELDAHSKPNPAGGKVHRCHSGLPSGLLEEAAQFYVVWPFLDQVTSMKSKLTAIDAAIGAYRRAGYTGLVDMAMGESKRAALNVYRAQRGEIPMHMAAHRLVPYSECEANICTQIDRAITIQQSFNRKTSPEFCINGIKLICDGTVDGCTAGLHQPYGGCSNIVDPIWPADALTTAIRSATDAGLQLGQLGIVASVQPVHLDPATFGAWPEMLVIHRCKRAFAYQEFVDGGAHMTFGTDALTAEHHALPNVYVATTRRSSIDPSSQETVNLSLLCRSQSLYQQLLWRRHMRLFILTGSLRPGYTANFVVLDMVWTVEPLLEARVCQTWYKGKKVFDEETDGF